MKQGDIARGALNSIRSSLKKYSMRRPPGENGEASPAARHVDPGPGDNSEDVNAETGETEEAGGFLTLDGVSGEPEMPQGDTPHPEEINDKPEPKPMRMLEYGIREVRKALAPGGTRPPAPVGPADTPQSGKRPRGRPRKVL